MKNKSAGRELVSFSIPLILSGLLQQLYNWTDAFILGNIEGKGALAAVGASSAVLVLFTLTVTGFTSGLGILAARYFGAGKWEELKKLLGGYGTVLVTASAVIALFGRAAVDPLLRLTDTPEDIFSLAGDYLRVSLWGTPFIILYNVYAATLRGVGNSRTPFVCVAISGALNVLLDWVAVGLLGKGVEGAAAATAISQTVGALIAVIYTVYKYEKLRFIPSPKIFDRAVMADGLRLGLPVTARMVISSLGSVLLQNFMNGFGSTTVAAISTSYRVDSMLLLSVNNLGVGISTMTSQSVGAKNEARARVYLSHGMRLMLGVSCVLTAVICVFGGQLVGMFGVGYEAADIGRRFFIRLSIFYPMYSAGRAVNGYLDGIGDVTFTGIIAVASLAVRLAASYALEGALGNMVLAWAEVISWVFALIAFTLRYCHKKKRSA